MITQLETRLRKLQIEGAGWISLDDRMPDSDLTVIIACTDGDEPVWFGYHDGDCWRAVDGAPVSVTHWQPLPEPPCA